MEHLGRAIYDGIFDSSSRLADAAGSRKDVLEEIRKLGVPVVRYAAGNFVSGHDWLDGVGPKENQPRALACWVTDNSDFSASESSVYPLLKRHGLIREVQVRGFPAGEEYAVKTTRPNEQWQSGATYLFVVVWAW